MLCCMMVTWLLACKDDVIETTGSIYGIVNDVDNGEPVSGAHVVLNPGGKTTNTGSDGRYEFLDMDPGQYTIQISKSGYKTNTKRISVVAGKQASGDMQLTPEPEEADLQIEPATLNFGTTQDELSVTITNKGNAATEWSLDLNDNSWLTASPVSGNIAAGKTQSIVFSVNRDRLSETKNVKISLSASGNSYTIAISCAPVTAKSEMTVTPEILDFGETAEEKTMTIKNTGDTSLNWSISDISEECISVSEMEGTIESEGSQVVKVLLDRSKQTKDLNTSFVISDGIKEQTIVVKAVKTAEKAEMKVEPTLLDFGYESAELPLTISNTGTAELEYSISGISVDYISVSSVEGKVPVDGNKVVQVMLNREIMPETVNTTFIISDGTKQESITVKAVKAVAKLSVSPLSLDFGEGATEQAFTISNIGTAELSWDITVPSGTGLNVSHASGVIAPSESKQILVTLDRSVMPETLNTAIEVSDGTHKEIVSVTAVKGSDVAGTVVTQGLYTYYKFDGNFEDATENGIDGFGTASPSFVDGITTESKAVKFSKTDNSTFVVSKPIIDSRQMTICFWGKDFSDGHIFHMNSSIRTEAMFTLSISNGSLKFLVTRYNNMYQYSNLPAFVHPTLTDGGWHHIALVSDFEVTSYSTITTTLYVDGQEVYTLTESANHFSENGGSQSSYDTGTNFTMGGSLKLNNSITLDGTNMSVDNFRVYDNRRLSASEIKEIFNAKQ